MKIATKVHIKVLPIPFTYSFIDINYFLAPILFLVSTKKKSNVIIFLCLQPLYQSHIIDFDFKIIIHTF